MTTLAFPIPPSCARVPDVLSHGSTKQALLVVTGRVAAGVDLERGAEVRIDSASRRITVTLPPAQLLSVDVLNVVTYDERGGLLNPFRAEPENGIPGVPVDIVYTKNNFLCTVRLGEEWRVRMADTLLANLNDWTKPDGVEVTY